MKSRISLAALAIALLPMGGVATAQNAYEQVVIDQLDVAEKEVERASVANNARSTFIQRLDGSAEAGGTERIDLTLRDNTLYTLVGACDQDCSDIDIVVYDQRGNVVEEDRLADDLPVVAFQTGSGDTYHYDLIMYNCSTNSCYYGVSLFRIEPN